MEVRLVQGVKYPRRVAVKQRVGEVRVITKSATYPLVE